MKMLDLDRRLIQDLSTERYEDVDVERLIYHRTGNRSDWDQNEYYSAAEDIVRELTK